MLNNIQLKLDSCAGAAVAIEIRMRLIGEFHDPVKNKLKEIVKKYQKDKKLKDTPPYEYWNCKLCFLDDAIDQIFTDKLTEIESKILNSFRRLRNEFMHANFVKLMRLMGIEATGRQVLANRRNTLNQPEIEEAIKSIERNQGFEKFRERANEVICILDKLISICKKEGEL